MQIVEVKPGVFACLAPSQGANAGFILTGQGAIVVDALDSPARGRQLAAAITERSERPVLLLVNTHHHFDHVLGNQAFTAPVLAHCALAEQLAQAAARDLEPAEISAWVSLHPEDRWLLDELDLRYPNIAFDSRLVIDLPPKRLILEHVGGHTPDSLIVDLPEEGVVLAGDLVFEGRVPYLRDAHIRDTIAALQRLQSLGSRTIIPGHGAVCDVSYVCRFREYLEALLSKVRDLMTAGWEKDAILNSRELPKWWTQDRPDLLQANIARVYDELAGL